MDVASAATRLRQLDALMREEDEPASASAPALALSATGTVASLFSGASMRTASELDGVVAAASAATMAMTEDAAVARGVMTRDEARVVWMASAVTVGAGEGKWDVRAAVRRDAETDVAVRVKRGGVGMADDVETEAWRVRFARAGVVLGASNNALLNQLARGAVETVHEPCSWTARVMRAFERELAGSGGSGDASDGDEDAAKDLRKWVQAMTVPAHQPDSSADSPFARFLSLRLVFGLARGEALRRAHASDALALSEDGASVVARAGLAALRENLLSSGASISSAPLEAVGWLSPHEEEAAAKELRGFIVSNLAVALNRPAADLGDVELRTVRSSNEHPIGLNVFLDIPHALYVDPTALVRAMSQVPLGPHVHTHASTVALGGPFFGLRARMLGAWRSSPASALGGRWIPIDVKLRHSDGDWLAQEFFQVGTSSAASALALRAALRSVLGLPLRDENDNDEVSLAELSSLANAALRRPIVDASRVRVRSWSDLWVLASVGVPAGAP